MRSKVSYVRDVGVAGSNPVTPTIDLHRVFLTPPDYGSSFGREDRAIFRLSVDACGRPQHREVPRTGYPATLPRLPKKRARRTTWMPFGAKLGMVFVRPLPCGGLARLIAVFGQQKIDCQMTLCLGNASPPCRSGSPGAAGVRISRYFGSFTANRSTCSICGG
jgi:hypothetical protein